MFRPYHGNVELLGVLDLIQHDRIIRRWKISPEYIQILPSLANSGRFRPFLHAHGDVLNLVKGSYVDSLRTIRHPRQRSCLA